MERVVPFEVVAEFARKLGCRRLDVLRRLEYDEERGIVRVTQDRLDAAGLPTKVGRMPLVETFEIAVDRH